MKKSKVILTVLFFGTGLLSNVWAQAPKERTWVGFENQDVLRQSFEDKTASLIKSSTYINSAAAKKAMQEFEGKKIKFNVIPPHRKPLTGAEVYAQVKPSFVSFASAYDCGNCHRTHLNVASGYIISEDGLVATNHHVVEGFTQNGSNKNLAMSVQTTDGEVFLVKEILTVYKDADLAIVRLDTRGKKLTPIPLGNTAKEGDDVYVLSNPSSMSEYFSYGVVARNYMGDVSNSVMLPQTDITADYAAGSSGAPIVDKYGNLVCTVSSTRSIYYDMQEQKNLQMVVKQTVPVILLKELLQF